MLVSDMMLDLANSLTQPYAQRDALVLTRLAAAQASTVATTRRVDVRALGSLTSRSLLLTTLPRLSHGVYLHGFLHGLSPMLELMMSLTESNREAVVDSGRDSTC